jgi:hypothetical protein
MANKRLAPKQKTTANSKKLEPTFRGFGQHAFRGDHRLHVAHFDTLRHRASFDALRHKVPLWYPSQAPADHIDKRHARVDGQSGSGAPPVADQDHRHPWELPPVLMAVEGHDDSTIFAPTHWSAPSGSRDVRSGHLHGASHASERRCSLNGSGRPWALPTPEGEGLPLGGTSASPTGHEDGQRGRGRAGDREPHSLPPGPALPKAFSSSGGGAPKASSTPAARKDIYGRYLRGIFVRGNR